MKLTLIYLTKYVICDLFSILFVFMYWIATSVKFLCFDVDIFFLRLINAI